ncbi:hypothetical protein APHAL10511_004997, partial [Amanita phalloides]
MLIVRNGLQIGHLQLSTHSNPHDKKKVKGTKGVANNEVDNTIDKRKWGKGN